MPSCQKRRKNSAANAISRGRHTRFLNAPSKYYVAALNSSKPGAVRIQHKLQCSSVRGFTMDNPSCPVINTLERRNAYVLERDQCAAECFPINKQTYKYRFIRFILSKIHTDCNYLFFFAMNFCDQCMIDLRNATSSGSSSGPRGWFRDVALRYLFPYIVCEFVGGIQCLISSHRRIAPIGMLLLVQGSRWHSINGLIICTQEAVDTFNSKQ